MTYLLFALGFVALVKGAYLLLLAAMFLGRRHVLDRWEGGVLLAGYLAYLGAGIARLA